MIIELQTLVCNNSQISYVQYTATYIIIIVHVIIILPSKYDLELLINKFQLPFDRPN